MKTVAFLAGVLLAVLAPCQGASASAPEPMFFSDILRQCNVKDQDSLDRCLYHILDSMRSYLPDGIPEWSIPVLEPLAIRSVSLDQGGGNTRIRATFKELRVSGLSNYTITYVKSDPELYEFTVGMQFAKLHIEGQYDIFGNLLLIPINGKGPFWADFRDVAADSYNWLEVARLQGPQGGKRNCLRLTHTQTDFDIGRVQLRLEDLFNKDEFLGETVNTFLNENARDIIRDMKPQFAVEINRLVKSVFSRAVAALPVESWLGRSLGEARTSPTTPTASSTAKERDEQGTTTATPVKSSFKGAKEHHDQGTTTATPIKSSFKRVKKPVAEYKGL